MESALFDVSDDGFEVVLNLFAFVVELVVESQAIIGQTQGVEQLKRSSEEVSVDVGDVGVEKVHPIVECGGA